MIERYVDAQELIDAVVDFPFDHYEMADEVETDEDYFFMLEIDELENPYGLQDPETVVNVIVDRGVVRFKLYKTNWDYEALQKMRERAIKFRETYPFNFSVIMDYNARELRIRGLQNWNGDKTYFTL